MLCFAYGSNMSARQMAARCPGATPAGTAELRDYRLAFVGNSRFRGGAVATVVKADGGTVRGVLWNVGRDGMAALDRCEGHPVVYCRRFMDVVCGDGRARRAWVYLHRGGPEGVSPGVGYLRIIRGAYRRNGFPREDIDRALEEVRA